MISDKVRPHHLERKALLYVRQSSAHQVLHNRESSALQYAMRDRLAGLGWSEIEVIDDDLGRSAAGGVQRAGSVKNLGQTACVLWGWSAWLRPDHKGGRDAVDGAAGGEDGAGRGDDDRVAHVQPAGDGQH